MDKSELKNSGVDRTYDRSIYQKSTFAVLHLTSVLICSWLIFLSGWETLGSLLGKDWSFTDPVRAKVMLVLAFIYWLRHLITLFYLLERKVDWSEVFGLSGFIAFFEISLVLLGGGAFRDQAIDLSWLDLIALPLLLIGSYLNSYSEIQRKWWKKDHVNKGHCYTEGLFKLSMHVNYFGDTILFTGWCLFSSNLWTLTLPLFMGLTFVFYHIPGLDSHLAKRYGSEFKTYAKKTKRFIPFIY